MAKKSFSQLIKSSEVPVLVDFYADWCGPCKAMNPVLKQFSKKMKDEVKVIKINVDRNPVASQNFQIRGVPTFMLFKDGEMVWRHSGMVQGAELESLVRRVNQ